MSKTCLRPSVRAHTPRGASAPTPLEPRASPHPQRLGRAHTPHRYEHTHKRTHPEVRTFAGAHMHTA